MRFALALLLCACGGGGHGADADAGEAPDAGVDAEADGSVPVVDDCGASEIPLVGGGCRRVGPVEGCWDGWVAGPRGTCDPVLPAEPCAAGTIALPGDAACEPLVDCGPAPWGNVVREKDAVYVDASYAGDDSDGSEARPYPGIDDALTRGSRRQIVVAAGEYDGGLRLQLRQRIAGRCPGLVTIRGRPDGIAVALISPGSSIEGVTVTGPALCIGTLDADGARIENVVTADCGAAGLQIQGEGTVTIRRTLVERNRPLGVLVMGGTPVFEGVVVRGNLPDDTGTIGYGMLVRTDPLTDLPADARIERSVIEGNISFGALVIGSTARFAEVVARDTRLDATGNVGVGVSFQNDSDGEILRSSFERNRLAGILLLGSHATIEDVSVQETQPAEPSLVSTFGFGVWCQGDPSTGLPSRIELRRFIALANQDVGIGLTGTDAVLEDVVVEGMLPRAWDRQSGMGIVAHDDPRLIIGSTLELRGARVARSLQTGVLIEGADAVLEDVVVEDTLGTEADGDDGRGIAVQRSRLTGRASSATLERVIVRRNRTAGVFVAGAAATLHGVVVQDTEAQRADGLFGDGVAAIRMTESGAPATLDVTGSWIERSARAALLYWGSDGSVAGSVLRDASYGLALEAGATVDLGDDVIGEAPRRSVGLAPPPIFSEFQP